MSEQEPPRFQFGKPVDRFPEVWGDKGKAVHNMVGTDFEKAVEKKRLLFEDSFRGFNAERSIEHLRKASNAEIEWFLNASDLEVLDAITHDVDGRYGWLHYH